MSPQFLGSSVALPGTECSSATDSHADCCPLVATTRYCLLPSAAKGSERLPKGLTRHVKVLLASKEVLWTSKLVCWPLEATLRASGSVWRVLEELARGPTGFEVVLL